MSDFEEIAKAAGLSVEESELFTHLLAQEGVDPPVNQISLTRRNKGVLPLSFSQQRLWFLDQLGSHNAYSISTIVYLKGRLDIAVLIRSLQMIIQRHEALRTTFEEMNNRPVQIVHPTMSVPLTIIDLQGIAKPKEKIELEYLTVESTQQIFDLSQGPLLQITLLQQASAEFTIILTMHHIISDGWSIGILVNEIATIYRALMLNDTPSLLNLPVQYADFTIWQRQRLQGKLLTDHLSYWSQQLKEMATLKLPMDFSRPQMQSFQGAYESFHLDSYLRDNLTLLSRSEGSTLFIVLLAAFKILLQRYSGQTDISIGTTVANRTHPEIEGLIGFFANTLVLRTQLDGNPSFRQLIGRVREVALGAYAHQDLPFEMLVESLQPERDLSRNPLVQVMCVLQNTPDKRVNLPELTMERLPINPQRARFDLALSMVETENGINGVLEYNHNLFSKYTVRQMISLLCKVLITAVKQPDIRLQQLRDILKLAAEQFNHFLDEQLVSKSVQLLSTAKRQKIKTKD